MPADDEVIVRIGVIDRREERSTQAGVPFVRCQIVDDDGDSWTANWWRAGAPPLGARVLVEGRWSSKHRSLSVERTDVVHTYGDDDPLERRLIAYYRACAERAATADESVNLKSRGSYVLRTDSAPLGIRSATIPRRDQIADRWLADRELAAGIETVFVGYPIVCTPDGETAGLFLSEVELVFDDSSVSVQPTSRGFELNPRALRLLGVHPDEVDTLVGGVIDRADVSAPDTLVDELARLARVGVLPADASDLDPDHLDGGSAGTVWNSAVLYVGEASAAMYRRLLEDLADLEGRPIDQLRAGPLGLLLGNGDDDPQVEMKPLPVPLPSTPQQDRAIGAALGRVLTVVTGPPGTGKTQVLANAVACAVVEGKSVLIASRNLQAIDVVYDRVRSISPDAAPVRIGRSSTRREAAGAMAEALARQPSARLKLPDAVQRWESTMARLTLPYQQLAERDELERKLLELDRSFADKVAGLPPDCADGLLLEDSLEELARLLREAQRSAAELRALPAGRWFWQRRRRRAAERDLTDAVQRACAVAPMRCASALTTQLVVEGESAVLARLVTMVEVAQLHSQRAKVARSLDLLPPRPLIEVAIEQGYETRRPAAAELLAATWADRFAAARGAQRGAASTYQQGLASAAGSGAGIDALRASMPGSMSCFPVWAVTSMSVGAYLPMQPGLFDLAIIDEASQSDIASALPVLFRAKQAMVVGDPDQLTHIPSVIDATNAVLAREFALDATETARYGYVQSSLYRVAADSAASDPVFLDRHYRSHPDIIGFANEAVYGGRLVINDVGNVDAAADAAAVRWVDVHGGYTRLPKGSALNPRQAEAIVQLIASSWTEWRDRGYDVGVVTPFRPQKELIVDLLRAADDARAFDVRVGTADAFQGDERDVVVLSPVVDRSSSEGHRAFAADRNRVNVSVTRARRQLIVVGDLGAAQTKDDMLGRLAGYIGQRQRGAQQ